MKNMNSVVSFTGITSKNEIEKITEDINRCGGNVVHISHNKKQEVVFLNITAPDEVRFWDEFREKKSCDAWVTAQGV